MEWFTFADVNWLAVGVAFLVTFVLSWFWYSPMVLFTQWAKADGLTEDKIKQANAPLAFSSVIVATLVGVVLLAMLMAATGAMGAWSGAALGAVLGLVMRGGAHWMHNGFAVRSWKVSLIDAAHDTVALGLAGLILGAMG